MKTTTPGELARLARAYEARAQPVAGSAEVQENDETEVDVRIAVTLHHAIKLVADYQRQQLTDVARAILFRTASKVTSKQVAEYRARRERQAQDAEAKAEKRARSRKMTEEQIEQAKARARGRVMRQRLPLRDYGTERYRLRFTVPTEAYTAARDAIQASGKSVAVAVEEGLYEYARNQRIN